MAIGSWYIANVYRACVYSKRLHGSTWSEVCACGIVNRLSYARATPTVCGDDGLQQGLVRYFSAQEPWLEAAVSSHHARGTLSVWFPVT